MIIPIEDKTFVSKSCWCGICDNAACECPIRGRWKNCDVNRIIEQDMDDKQTTEDIFEDN